MKFTNSALRIAVFAVSLTALIGWAIMPTTTFAGDTKTKVPHTGEHKMGVHPTTHAKVTGPFDGKQFEGTCGADGKTDGTKEEVSFRNGMFKSSYCLSQGFKLAPYTGETKDGVSSFKSQQTDPAKGTLVWEGTITGDNLTANGTLTSPGKEPAKFWIKATMKAPEHAAQEPGGKK